MSGISVDWPPETTVGAALTLTCTGIETDTPVPVNVMLPVYVPAKVSDAVLKVIDRLAVLDWLTLKLAAESPIHVWLALTVSETAAADVVLNWTVCAAVAGVPMVQLALRDAGAGVTVRAVAAAVTFTTTGMATETPVPVKAMLPLYVPATLNDWLLKITDRLAGFDWLMLKLVAESPIQDWLALAVSATAAADVVLN
jgi:hypothetical protein